MLNHNKFLTGRASPYSEVAYLAHDWHRDVAGRDWLDSDGISVGQIISGSAWIGFASLFREYRIFKQQIMQDGVIRLSSDASPLQRTVAHRLGKVLDNDMSGGDAVRMAARFEERKLSCVPGEGRYGRWLHRLQVPISRHVRRRRNMYFDDWTSRALARSDSSGLVLNARNLLHGAYCRLDHKSCELAEQLFPARLSLQLTPQCLSDVLGRAGITWDDALVQLCSDYLHRNYSLNRSYLVRALALYNSMFEYYRPEIASIPGEVYEPYTIALQLARRHGIRSRFLIDGYLVFSSYPYLRNAAGDDWLIDEFAAYGDAARDHFLMRGVAPDRCTMMAAPLLYRHAPRKCPRIYDVIVMTWIPMHLNPDCRVDAGPEILRSAVSAAIEAGITRIAVKVKSEAEIPYVRNILTELGLDQQVPILTGYFFDHVQSAHAVIGGISTGIVETLFHDIPYYIFEPAENGYSDEIIALSVLYNRQSIARTQEELTDLIRDRRGSCIVNKDYVFAASMKGTETLRVS